LRVAGRVDALVMAFAGSPPRFPHLPPRLPPPHDVEALDRAKLPVSAAVDRTSRSATGVHCSACGASHHRLWHGGGRSARCGSRDLHWLPPDPTARADRMRCDAVPAEHPEPGLSGWKDPSAQPAGRGSSCRISPPTRPGRAGSPRQVAGTPTPARRPLPFPPRLGRPSFLSSPIPQLLGELGGEGARDRVVLVNRGEHVLLGDRRPPAAQSLVCAGRTSLRCRMTGESRRSRRLLTC
jgi:hypothetical protein